MSEKNEVMPIDQHPYVQGLAQIGRNAVDRVIELEQARARDNIAFKQLLAQRDALLETLKEVTQILDMVLGVTGGYPPGADGPAVKARAAIKAVEEGK